MERSRASAETLTLQSGSPRAGRDASDDPLSLRLAARVDEVLAPLIPAGSTCALLGFPTSSNVGDSAIWLGQRVHLARRGVTVAYVSDVATYAPGELRRRLPRGPILLSGGGNLGDMWPEHQRFRETVIRDFPDYPIVQLPQTIHFQESTGLDRVRRILEEHPAFTLLLRDHESLALARRALEVPSALCPDMAFALGPLARPSAARRPVLWLAREDLEARGETALDFSGDVVRIDWLDGEAHGVRRLAKGLRRRLARRTRSLPALARRLAGIREGAAEDHLRRGCALLSSGRAVITDRLHGHVLSLLLGIPHVLLDTRHGKTRAFYETWTRESSLACFAESDGDALRLARALADAADPTPR